MLVAILEEGHQLTQNDIDALAKMLQKAALGESTFLIVPEKVKIENVEITEFPKTVLNDPEVEQIVGLITSRRIVV